MTEHKSWCWSVWTPFATIGGFYKSGSRKGQPKVTKRDSRCNCGAAYRSKQDEEAK